MHWYGFTGIDSKKVFGRLTRNVPVDKIVKNNQTNMSLGK